MIKAFLKKTYSLLFHSTSYSEDKLISRLKKNGMIGDNCKFFEPNTVHIDMQRPHMLHIGSYCKICRNVTILAHDYSRSVIIMCENENIGEARHTYIGNNVFIGMNAIILMGAHIGDNSIIGAGSVVSGSFPDGVVIAGNPARAICTIQEYVEKRRGKVLAEAVDYARSWEKKYGSYPGIEQMGNAFSWLYLPRTQAAVDRYPCLFNLSGIDSAQYIVDFMNSEPVFDSYEAFLNYVKCNS